MYIALFTNIDRCYLWSGALLDVVNDRGCLNNVYTATAADRYDTQPPPQARKYSPTGPNTGPGLPHPTGPEPTRHVQFIVVDKQDNTFYTHGSLPSAHTPTDFT